MLHLGETALSAARVSLASGQQETTGAQSGFVGYCLDQPQSNNGIYLRWQQNADSFVLENDAYGMQPVFYRRDSTHLHYSSCISDLLSESTALNESALAVFLRTSTFLGDSTPYQNIHALAPGSRITVGHGSVELQTETLRCGDFAHLSRAAAQQRYGELFDAACGKFAALQGSTFDVPLSGGRDSRHILLGLMAQNLPPRSCVTLKHQPPKPQDDALIAARVAQALGLTHVVLDQSNSLLQSELSKNQLCNFGSIEHSWLLPLADHLNASGSTAIFDGIAGDVLSAGLNLNPARLALYRQNRLEELAQDILGDEGYLPRMLSPEAYARYSRDKAIAAVVAELKKHADTPNPVGQFYFWNRTRRHISNSGWRLLAQGRHVFAPFLDRDIYDLLSGLPAEYFLDHRFHDEVIAQRYPEYVHLPYEDKSSPATWGGAWSNRRQLIEFTAYFMPSLKANSSLSARFLYPKILQGLLRSAFYDHNRGLFRIPVYVQQLEATRA